jgi:hypothetical protein
VSTHTSDTTDAPGATTITARTSTAAAAIASPSVASPTTSPAAAQPSGDSQRFFTAAEKLLDGVEQLLASKRRAPPPPPPAAAAGGKPDPEKAAARAAEMQAMQSMLQDLTNALHTGPQEEGGGGGEGNPVVSTPSLLLGQVRVHTSVQPSRHTRELTPGRCVATHLIVCERLCTVTEGGQLDQYTGAIPSTQSWLS